MKLIPILVLLIALNLLLGLLNVYGYVEWVTFILVAIIGLLLVTGKEK